VTAMMRLDTKPMTPSPRARRATSDGIAVLIQVPRVELPRGRARAGPSRRISSRARDGRGGRTRRRLRPGVRLAGWSLLALASMAGTFAMGWTTRGASFRLPVLRASSFDRDAGALAAADGDGERPAGDPAGEADAIAIGPALAAPVADAEVPVVFPGYVLPDDSREEPAHEGS
jgi:hypothetical protein